MWTYHGFGACRSKYTVKSFTAVIDESQVVPIAWVCGHAKAPSPMVLKGEDKTTVPDEFLPRMCR